MPDRTHTRDKLDASLHMKNENLAFVQALRGIAALMVVLLHIFQQQALPLEDKGLFQWLVGSGGAGVPMFFIISGFIMVYSTRDITPNAQAGMSFAVKRFSRIWPTYVVLTILFWSLVTLADKLVGATFPYSIGSIVRSLLFIPLTMDSSPAPIFGGAVLYPGWSLNYEIYFYLLLTICLFFGRFRWHTLLMILTVTLVGLPLLNGHHPTLDIANKNGYSSYLALVSSPLIWEFGAGVVIGLVYLSNVKIQSKGTAVFLCFFSASLVIWILLSKAFWGMGMEGWGWSLTLMFLCLALSSKTVQIPAPRALVWLGDISYSLYLVHPLILKPTFDIGWETSYRESMRDPSFAIVIIVASIGAAALSRRYLELSLSNYLRDKLLSLFSTKSSQGGTAGVA
ncbi:acyltransferase family protein [Ralstonia edaphi]|nr:acyltransferase [Ralstonia sp. LMG 6871]